MDNWTTDSSFGGINDWTTDSSFGGINDWTTDSSFGCINDWTTNPAYSSFVGNVFYNHNNYCPTKSNFDNWEHRSLEDIEFFDDFFTKDLDKPKKVIENLNNSIVNNTIGEIWYVVMLFFIMSIIVVTSFVLYNNPEIINVINDYGDKISRNINIHKLFNIALEYSKDTYNTISTEVAAIYSKYIH